MPRPVYSTRFIIKTMNVTPPNNTATYTVPAGFTAIIRTFTIGATATPARTAYLFAGPAGTTLLDSIQDPTVAIVGKTASYNGLVVPTGETITIQCVIGSFGATLNGYLLSN